MSKKSSDDIQKKAFKSGFWGAVVGFGTASITKGIIDDVKRSTKNNKLGMVLGYMHSRIKELENKQLKMIKEHSQKELNDRGEGEVIEIKEEDIREVKGNGKQ